MKSDLRILLLEDSPADVELIRKELEGCDLSFRLGLVQSEGELRRALENETPDLILSDHGLPSFDGFTALRIVRETNPELPFIFVSGSNDQEMIIEMFERGATDYVFKNDIDDLEGAVHRALEPAPRPAASATETEAAPAPVKAAPVGVPKAVSVPNPVHLTFCPQCMNARSEDGKTVWLVDYFKSNIEVVVSRKVCSRCEKQL